MKKIIITTLLIIMMIIQPEKVNAAEEDTTTYVIDALCAETNYQDGWVNGVYLNGSLEMKDNYKVVAWVRTFPYGEPYKRTQLTFIIYDNELNICFETELFDNLSLYAASSNFNGKYGMHYGNDNSNWYHTAYEVSKLVGDVAWVYKNSMEEVGYIKTNIPIFDSEDKAIGYINGSVSIKEASNYEDVAPCMYGVLEVPQNIKVSSPVTGIFADQDITITWTQNDENYLKWDTEILVYSSIKARPALLGISFADWTHYNDVFLFDDKISCRRMKYLIKDSDLIDYQFEWLENNATDGYNVFKGTEITIFMRNKYFDGNKTYYSNWVKILVDLVDNFISEEDSTAILEELDYNNITGDEGQDFTNTMPSGNVNNDSSYNGTIIENQNAGLDIISYIKDGFGLLGDNGIVAMMSDALSFVPDFVWVIISAGLAIMVVIGVAKYIF